LIVSKRANLQFFRRFTASQNSSLITKNLSWSIPMFADRMSHIRTESQVAKRSLAPRVTLTLTLILFGIMVVEIISHANRLNGTVPTAFGQNQGTVAAPLTSGNLVIYRIGDGSAAPTSAATAVFLDEYSTSGTLVQSIPMPTATSGANRKLTASGTASSEGCPTRSVDGKFVTLMGYDAAVGTASITSSSSSTINRVVGIVNANGQVDTSTALTDAVTGSNPRGVASTDGLSLWVTGGAGGVRYTTAGSTSSTQLSTSVTNLRVLNIFDNQLYTTSASGAFRLASVGSGTPTTSGQTITNLPGFPTSSGSPYGFFFADLDGTAGVDTVTLPTTAPALVFRSIVW
jgi:hypothetical protein